MYIADGTPIATDYDSMQYRKRAKDVNLVWRNGWTECFVETEERKMLFLMRRGYVRQWLNGTNRIDYLWSLVLCTRANYTVWIELDFYLSMYSPVAGLVSAATLDIRVGMAELDPT